MRTLTIAFAAMGVMLVAGWAEATALTGTGTLPSTRDYSPVEKVGCKGPARCAYGLHWACGPHGRCGCVSCSYVRPRY
jgi:hypothetical protein